MRTPPAWLDGVRAHALQPPRAPRQLLWLGPAVIGSIEPGYVQALHAAVPATASLLQALPGAGWTIAGGDDAALAGLAGAIRAAGLAGPWRDELLAVHDEVSGRRVGVIERGAVRPLGIATAAVHLLARAPDGRHWVQQRAFTKPNDPGLWDTLMGGMVPAADTLQQALARETWEEAGLSLHALRDLRAAGRVATRRPCEDGRGSGYVIEHIDWFDAVVPADVLPVNQDGEVECFELWSDGQLQAALATGRFTTEAALIYAAWLGL